MFRKMSKSAERTSQIESSGKYYSYVASASLTLEHAIRNMMKLSNTFHL